MSEVERLEVVVEGNINPLGESFTEAIGEAESFARDMGSVRVAPDMGTATAGVAGMGEEIRTAIMQGMAPLGGFAARFEKSFDRVGGTITTLARRLDAAMKFPAFDAFLGKVQDRMPTAFGKGAVGAVRGLVKIKEFLGNMGDVAGKGLGKLGIAPVPGGTIASYGRLAGNITGIGPAARAAAGPVRALGGHLAMTLGLFSGAGAVVAFFAKGIRGASDLGETVSKVDQIFGTSAGKVGELADDMAADFGLPKQAILDATSAIGLVGKAAGQSEGKAADLGMNMARLAADASSFYNIPLDDALNRIRSGLVGEAEPMRALGVLLSEEAVKAEAMRLGLARGSAELSNQAKVAARASLITKGLADATGDLERTQGSTANQSRKLVGSVGNLATSIGGALLPAVDTVLRGFNDFTTRVGEWVGENQPMIDAFGAYISDVFINVGDGLGNFIDGFMEIGAEIADTLGLTSGVAGDFGKFVLGIFDEIGFAWRHAGDILKLVWISMKQGAINVGETLGTIPANLQIIGDWIGSEWVHMISDAVNFVGSLFTNLGKNLWELGQAFVKFLQDPTQGFQFNWTPLLEGFKASTAAMPDLLKPQLTSLQAEMDKVLTDIGASEVKHAEDVAAKGKEKAKAKVGVPKAGPLGEMTTGKDKGPQFAGALSLASKEAYSAVVKASGAGSNDGISKVEKATRDGNKDRLAQTALLAGIKGGVEGLAKAMGKEVKI